MASSLDRILCMLETPPPGILHLAARYDNVRLLRSYKLIHVNLVYHAVKGNALRVLKLLLTQKSSYYDVKSEISEAISHACEYNKPEVLHFIKTLCLGILQFTQSEYNACINCNACITYILECDSVECYKWLENENDTLTRNHMRQVYENDSVEILNYLYHNVHNNTHNNTHTNAHAKIITSLTNEQIKYGISQNSIKCLKFMYSVAPFEITDQYIEAAMKSYTVDMLRWFNSITVIDDTHIYRIACYGAVWLWPALTDRQLLMAFDRCDIAESDVFIHHCVVRNVVTESMLISCCKIIVKESNIIDLLTWYVQCLPVRDDALTATLLKIKDVAIDRDMQSLINTVEQYIDAVGCRVTLWGDDME